MNSSKFELSRHTTLEMCRILQACKANSWSLLQSFSASFKIGTVRCCQFFAIHSLTSNSGKNVCRCRGSSRRTYSLRDSSIACRKDVRRLTVSSVMISASVSPNNWLFPNDGRGVASFRSSVSFAGLHFQIWRKHTSSTKIAHHLYRVISSQRSDSPEFSQVSTFVTVWTFTSLSLESSVAASSLLWFFNALISAFMLSTD